MLLVVAMKQMTNKEDEINIGLDYDDTYTRHPYVWDKVIEAFRKGGHKVYVVTWRFEEEMQQVYEALDGKVHGFYPTGRKAKEKFMFDQGINVDVWIDDNPRAILVSMQGY